ncbi:MAG: hypothetical protein H0V29_07000 [Thermoleophilaceae bacterium]|nr:hypothetical protein [Thermoleophilaceae bacterium]
MAERLADIHVIEPGADGEPTLFKVQLLVHDDTRDQLDQGDERGWHRVIGRTRMLIAEHLDDRERSEGERA